MAGSTFHLSHLLFLSFFFSLLSRDNLPYGTSIALKAASFIDPNLTHDLYADKPWAFSPLLATMNKAHVIRSQSSASDPSSSSSSTEEESEDFSNWPPFPSPQVNPSNPEDHYVKEDISKLFYTKESNYQEMDESLSDFVDMGELHNLKSGNATTRGHLLGKKELRKKLKLGKDDVVDVDFCNGFIDFNTLKIELPHTGGWGIDREFLIKERKGRERTLGSQILQRPT